MRTFLADLHIHTTLSPCGDLDMHPVRIVEEAVRRKLDIIGITDHNTTRHCRLITRLAAEKGIMVLQGAEVNTKEEVHCLTFFETDEKLELFQDYLSSNLPDIKNDPELFGYQVQVDEYEQIVYEEPVWLFGALNKPVGELCSFVHSIGGIFIPSHIDRQKNSLYSQLGFLPADLEADALELSRMTAPGIFEERHPEISRFTIVRSSDAHTPELIGSSTTAFLMEKASFGEIKAALRGENGRRTVQL
jgi:3',5'-nucleoside bisphosphate phosphatase